MPRSAAIGRRFTTMSRFASRTLPVSSCGQKLGAFRSVCRFAQHVVQVVDLWSTHCAPTTSQNLPTQGVHVMNAMFRRAVPAIAGLLLMVGLGAGAARAQIVVVERAMPAPIVEVVPATPGAGYAWVPDHWVWRDGAWFWVKGHHIRGVVAAMPAPIVEVVPARPSPAHYWVKGHYGWEKGRWAWHAGVWVR